MGHLAACEGPYFLRTARQPEPAADAVFRCHPEPSDQLFGPHRACLLIQTIAWQAPVSTVVESWRKSTQPLPPALRPCPEAHNGGSISRQSLRSRAVWTSRAQGWHSSDGGECQVPHPVR